MRVLDKTRDRMGWDGMELVLFWLGPTHSCPRFKRVSAWTPFVADGGIGVEVWNLIWCLATSREFVLIVKGGQIGKIWVRQRKQGSIASLP